MTQIALQIALPDEATVSRAELAKITGRDTRTPQIRWLKENGWNFELAADGAILVGKLYAHLRLAGLHPTDLLQKATETAGGFDLGKVR